MNYMYSLDNRAGGLPTKTQLGREPCRTFRKNLITFQKVGDSRFYQKITFETVHLVFNLFKPLIYIFYNKQIQGIQ